MMPAKTDDNGPFGCVLLLRAMRRIGFQHGLHWRLAHRMIAGATNPHYWTLCYRTAPSNNEDAPIVTTQPSKNLETFPNPKPGRDYTIRIELPEFTCLCPLTGQPDFANILLEYVPHESCLELKALKLYIWSFRDQGGFHEALTNQILDDILTACSPRFARVTAKFNVRGGTYPTIVAEFSAPGWQAPPQVVLP